MAAGIGRIFIVQFLFLFLLLRETDFVCERVQATAGLCTMGGQSPFYAGGAVPKGLTVVFPCGSDFTAPVRCVGVGVFFCTAFAALWLLQC
jgi:hypothetical protein